MYIHVHVDTYVFLPGCVHVTPIFGRPRGAEIAYTYPLLVLLPFRKIRTQCSKYSNIVRVTKGKVKYIRTRYQNVSIHFPTQQQVCLCSPRVGEQVHPALFEARYVHYLALITGLCFCQHNQWVKNSIKQFIRVRFNEPVYPYK